MRDRPSGGRRFALALLISFLAGSLAGAQPRRARPIALTNATVHTMAGEVMDGVTVLIVGRKIAAVGPDVQIPRGADIVDATGKTVVPGFIDADSALAVIGDDGTQRRAFARSIDAVDPFDRHAVRAALAQGVTTVFVTPPGNAAFFGIGCVLKLDPRPLDARLVEGEAALCGALGAGRRMQTVVRLKEEKSLRKLLEQAEAYREALEQYEEDLEEYAEKIRKRQKDSDGESKEKQSDEETPEKKDPPPEKDSPPEKDEEPGEEDEEPDPDKEPLRTERAALGELDWLFAGESPAAGASADVRYVRAEPEKGKEAPKDEKKKEDDLKKPKEVPRDPNKQILARALGGEIPVRIEAHRAEDILNVLEIAREYPMRLVLTGLTEGYKVRETIADAGVAVVVRHPSAHPRYATGQDRGADPRNAALLREAGVDVAIGSGGDGTGRTPLLWMSAAIAASHGLPPEEALAAITSRAAKILGIDDRTGSIEPEKDADLVILTGSPFAGDTRVETVFVEGRRVYSAP